MGGPGTAAAVLAAVASLAIGSAAAGSPFLTTPDRIAVDGAAGDDVAVLDFNGDGVPDIALVGHRTVELVLGRPDGWDPQQTVTIPGGDSYGPSRLAVADLDADGRDDLIVAVPGLGTVDVLRGRADGTLTLPDSADVHAVASPDGSYAPWPVTALDIGDLNGDGSPDVVAMFTPAGSFSGTVTALVNDTHGALAAQPALTLMTPSDVQLVRLAGDSDLDLAVAQGTGGGPPPPGRPPGKMSVLPGGPQATFGAPTDVTTIGEAVSLAAGDVNADGRPDVVVGARGNDIPGPEVLPGSATGPTLGAPSFLHEGFPTFGTTVQTVDADRDGRTDVAVDGEGHYGVAVLTGRRTYEVGAYTFPDITRAWTIADADADGKPDVVALTHASGGAPLRVYYGSGPVVRPALGRADFGPVAVGSASAPATGAFTNDGPGTASDLALIADGDIGDFQLVGDACSGASLAIGQSCNVTVRFQPTATGDRALAAALVAPDSDQAYWIVLHGTGVVPASTAASPSPAVPAVSAPAPASPKTASGTLRRARAARIVTRHSKMVFDSGWRATCPAPGPRCTATLLLVARAKPGHRAPVLARATLTVNPGAARDLVAPVTRSGRAALAHRRRIAAVLRLASTRTGATETHTQKDLTVRAGR